MLHLILSMIKDFFRPIKAYKNKIEDFIKVISKSNSKIEKFY